MTRPSRLRPDALSPPPAGGRWSALAAGLLWLVAGLGAGYWGLRIGGGGPVTPVPATAPAVPRPDVASVARALGAAAPAAAEGGPVLAAPAPSRWRLLGVVAQPGQQGAALISMDGQPPRPYTVGATLDGGLVLQSVTRQGVRLGPQMGGASTVVLDVPPPAAN